VPPDLREACAGSQRNAVGVRRQWRMAPEGFRPFTLTHALALALIAVAIALLVLAARRANAAGRMHVERSLAGINALFWVAAHGW
jgi:hypothetical protein